MILLIVVAFFLLVLYLIYASYFKTIRVGCATEITGGIKTGKTQWSVSLICKLYNIQKLKYYIALIRWKLSKKRQKKEPKPEKPLIYSNMPVGRPYKDYYVPLTREMLARKERPRYGSVVYLSEASLIAGSRDIYDEEINDELNQWIKLFGHMTWGGYCIIDTQSPMDMHFAFKRSSSMYYYILDRKDYFFKTFSVLRVRQMMLLDGEKSETVINDDPDDHKHNGNKPYYYVVLLNRKWWKRYDRYAYSYFTDSLPVNDRLVQVTKDRKVKKLVRFRKQKK